jgi:hypothetical protein
MQRIKIKYYPDKEIATLTKSLQRLNAKIEKIIILLLKEASNG